MARRVRLVDAVAGGLWIASAVFVLAYLLGPTHNPWAVVAIVTAQTAVAITSVALHLRTREHGSHDALERELRSIQEL